MISARWTDVNQGTRTVCRRPSDRRCDRLCQRAGSDYEIDCYPFLDATTLIW